MVSPLGVVTSVYLSLSDCMLELGWDDLSLGFLGLAGLFREEVCSVSICGSLLLLLLSSLQILFSHLHMHSFASIPPSFF